MVLSGPNMSGKSALLKSIGILVILAQTGCFVPADAASLYIMDRIFTRIEATECLGYSLSQSINGVPGENKYTSSRFGSAFGLDVNQMKSMLRYSTSTSLLLIDEFGKGTNTADGASLLLSSLDHLINRFKDYGKTTIPFTICVTHFHKYFQPTFFKHPDVLQQYQMKVHFQKHDSDASPASPEEVELRPVPLFTVAPGATKGSFGINCAEKSAVPKEVVARARAILHQFEAGRLPLVEVPCNSKDKQLGSCLQVLMEKNWDIEQAEEIRTYLETLLI